MKNEDPKLLNSRLLLKSSPFNVLNTEYRLPDGSQVEKRVIDHPGAVVVLPQESDGRLLLVRQYRYAIAQWLLEFPAGTLEEKEPPLECARRELSEEVGKRAEHWQSLGELYPTPGFCNEKQSLFLAQKLSGCPGTLDHGELIGVEALSVAEIETAIIRGDLRDAKSIAAFAKARFAGWL
jgi:ADP-ribose pyrophosphatase